MQRYRFDLKLKRKRQGKMKKEQKIVYLQRERRDQVEPRCAERWHLCDDEQFDLAAWLPSLS